MFIAWGPERTLLYNDGYSKMLGPKHPKAFARPFFEVWPEVRSEIGGLMDRVFSGEPIAMEDLALTLNRNGYPEEASFSFSYTPVPDNTGKIVGLFCACTETTGRVTAERRQADDAKRERDRLFEMSRDLFGVATLDGYLVSINPAWARQLERPVEELLARPFSEIIHPEDLAETGAVVARLSAGEAVHQFHVRLLKADGMPISFAWSAVPEAGGKGNLFYTVGRDISDDIRREEAIRHGQKMEAVGQLTGGLAHDFNNLLQAAHGCLDLILRKPQDSDRVARLARNGLQATERGAKLTAQLLAFSRSQKFELRPIDVASLIAGMTDILHSSVGPLIRVVIHTSQSSFGVLSDPTQLEMALLNVAINARDAMPQGGDLIIAATPREINMDPELLPGNYVQIAITDTGIGMPAAVAARAFEPFYTTKGLGKGTGLGLSQVYAMAKQAGGTARIEKWDQRGTRISLWLPSVVLAPVTVASIVDAAPSVKFVAKRVLVVDDDPDVREFLTSSLETLGFDVRTAVDAERGLEVLEEVKPDILVVDFAMPGMNGAQMARVVRQRRPNLPIIFASGYSETEEIEGAVGKSAALLRKPFGVSELETVLNAVLDPH
jgi:PAS domain S-box-containing protein